MCAPPNTRSTATGRREASVCARVPHIEYKLKYNILEKLFYRRTRHGARARIVDLPLYIQTIFILKTKKTDEKKEHKAIGNKKSTEKTKMVRNGAEVHRHLVQVSEFCWTLISSFLSLFSFFSTSISSSLSLSLQTHFSEAFLWKTFCSFLFSKLSIQQY